MGGTGTSGRGAIHFAILECDILRLLSNSQHSLQEAAAIGTSSDHHWKLHRQNTPAAGSLYPLVYP